MKAEITFARFLSTVLHPLLIPTLGMIILFNLETYVAYSIPQQARWLIMLIVLVNTAIAPLLTVFMLKKTRIVKDVMLDERSDRLFPLMFTALFFFLTYYLLKMVTMPSVVYFYIIGASLLVVSCLVISFYWKISIHMTSAGGLTGFLIVTSLLLKLNINMLIIMAILVSGLLGFSRIRLGSHTPAQVYAGYTLGVGGMLLLYAYLSF